MESKWRKSETCNGLPYYINHSTEATQWDHPDLLSAMQSLSALDNIQYGAYRTAAKLRKMQKVFHMDVVDLITVRMAFDLHGYSHHNDSVMDGVQLYNIIYEMYHMTKVRGRSTIKVNRCTDLLLNWLLNLFDISRTGCVRVLPVKLGMAVICAGRISDKYRYFEDLLADRRGRISRKMMTEFMHDVNQITMMVGESRTFGKGAAASVDDCFQSTLGESIYQDDFHQWLLSEPQTLIWLPTLHRFAAAETMKHEVKCVACKMYPIIGLRYQCLKCFNFDLCQNCFFTRRSSKHHKPTHPIQEYCLSSKSKEDIQAFTKTLRNNMSKKHGRRIKKKYHSIEDRWDSDDRISDNEGAKFETHVRLSQMSERLQAVEIMHPPRLSHSLLPSVKSTRPSITTATTDESRYQERRELEDLIDELEKENDELMDDLEQLGLHVSTSSASSSDTERDHLKAGASQRGRTRLPKPPHSERTIMVEQGNEVSARYEILQEHNKRLEEKLRNMKIIIRKRENDIGRTNQSMGSAHPSSNHSPAGHGHSQHHPLVSVNQQSNHSPAGHGHSHHHPVVSVNQQSNHSPAGHGHSHQHPLGSVSLQSSHSPAGDGHTHHHLLGSVSQQSNHSPAGHGHSHHHPLVSVNQQSSHSPAGHGHSHQHPLGSVSLQSSHSPAGDGHSLHHPLGSVSLQSSHSPAGHGHTHHHLLGSVSQQSNHSPAGHGHSHHHPLVSVNQQSSHSPAGDGHTLHHPLGSVNQKSYQSSGYQASSVWPGKRLPPYGQSHPALDTLGNHSSGSSTGGASVNPRFIMMSHDHPDGPLPNQESPTNHSQLGALHMNKSRALESVLDYERFLPNLEDQSTIHFPTMDPSMMSYPSHEAELNDLIERMTDAFPLHHDSPPMQDVPVVTMEKLLEARPQRPRGRGCRSGDLFSAANRIGEAMSSLVTRVSVAGTQG